MTQIFHKDVCIIGFGPASIGAALELSNHQIIKNTIIIEAGNGIQEKKCSILKKNGCKKDKVCSIIGGFGGSSILGGSKLSNFPAGSKIAEILDSSEQTKEKFTKSLKLFEKFVAISKNSVDPSTIKLSQKKFTELGFKYKYYDVYKFRKRSIIEGYKRIESLLSEKGSSFYYNTVVISIESNGKNYKIISENSDGQIVIYSKYVIVGVGRLGYDLLEKVNQTFHLNAIENPIDIGVRLEFLSEKFPDIDQTHGDLKLLFAEKARTFCVCKGGKIAQYFLDGFYCTEGYLDFNNITKYTNVAIIIRVENIKYSFLKEFVTTQLNQLVKIGIIRQTYLDYQNSTNKNDDQIATSIDHWNWGDINKLFPDEISMKIKNAVVFFVTKVFQKKDINSITIFAPEVHRNGYKFSLKKDFSIYERIYLVGECSGAFRGILQSFCSGVICAESIISEEKR